MGTTIYCKYFIGLLLLTYISVDSSPRPGRRSSTGTPGRTRGSKTKARQARVEDMEEGRSREMDRDVVNEGTELICGVDDVALLRSLRCADGAVGEGAHCRCPQQNCSIAYLRSYLPSQLDIDATYYNATFLRCNRDAYFGLARYRLEHSQFVPYRGYPLHVECSPEVVDAAVARRTYHYCLNSLGKHLRYNSLMAFHHFSGAAMDLIPEAEYPSSWRTSRHIKACRSKGRKLEGWNCVFNKMSATMEEMSRLYEAIVPPEVFSTIGSLRRHRRNHIVQMVLYGHALAQMAAPSPAASDYLIEHITELYPEVSESGRPAVSVSMHVRQGDSCDFVLLDEDGDAEGFGRTRYLNEKQNFSRPCYSIDVYMKKLFLLKRLYGVRRVYLATDSPDMLTRARRETSFHWVFVDAPKDALHPRNGWVDFHSASDSEAVALSAVADLTLMQAGDIFLGAFTSHFSKLSFYLMVGQQMRIPPFISLDYPLSCDTVDKCSDEDIARRGLSVAEIIGWAPECVRVRDGGWVRDDLDACGVYMETARNQTRGPPSHS